MSTPYNSCDDVPQPYLIWWDVRDSNPLSSNAVDLWLRKGTILCSSNILNLMIIFVRVIFSVHSLPQLTIVGDIPINVTPAGLEPATP